MLKIGYLQYQNQIKYMGAEICGNSSSSEKFILKYRDRLPSFIDIEQAKSFLEMKKKNLESQATQKYGKKQKQLKQYQDQAEENEKKLAAHFQKLQAASSKELLSKSEVNQIFNQINQKLNTIPRSYEHFFYRNRGHTFIIISQFFTRQKTKLQTLQEPIPQYQKLSEKDKNEVLNRVINENRELMEKSKSQLMEQIERQLSLQHYLQRVNDYQVPDIFRVVDEFLKLDASILKQQKKDCPQIINLKNLLANLQN